VSRRIYETFLTRQLEITGTEDLEQADSRIVSAAQPPLEPSFPKKTLVILLALGAGTLVGMFLAFLMDSLDDTFKQPRDIAAATGLRPIGFLPIVRRAEKAISTLIEQPRSSFSEAVRSIRTSLSLADRDVVGQIVLVTSSQAGEGKSLLATSLARSTVQAGRTALLIDCDLRHPTVGALLGDRSGPGLPEYLDGRITIEEIIRRDETGGVDYISAAGPRIAGSPQDLLASANMRSLLSRVQTQYDVVILDAPPVLAVSDPVVLSRMADAIVFVIRWRHTSKEAVASALQALHAESAPVVGAVLSHMNIKRYAKLGFRDAPAYRRAHAGYYR
jgi:capsular exopolysaccharide synthesis family protein